MATIEQIKDSYAEMVNQINLKEPSEKAFAVRIKRAMSWLIRAENEVGDVDAKVIFLWIAFNALYGNDRNQTKESKEQKDQKSFLKEIVKIDNGNIHEAIKSCSDEYTNIMTNRYICKEYWNQIRFELSNSKIRRGQEGEIDGDMEKEWGKKDIGYGEIAEKFLKGSGHDEKELFDRLDDLFKRLYELRNQVIHGNAAWNKEINRDQVENGCKVLETLIPVFVELILMNTKNIKNASKIFGKKVYRPPYRRWNERDYYDLEFSP